MELHISGIKVDSDVKKIGFDGGVLVEAQSFSGGIWCLWNTARLKVKVLATTTQCVHLEINPSHPDVGVLSIIYGNPHLYARETLWEDLVSF